MNESEKIDPRELSPLGAGLCRGQRAGTAGATARLVEHHRLSAGKLNVEKVKYVSAKAQFREEQLLEPLFTEDELAVFKRGRNASKASVAKARFPGGIPCFYRFRVPVGLAVSERTAEACAPAVRGTVAAVRPLTKNKTRKPAAFRTGKQWGRQRALLASAVRVSGCFGVLERLLVEFLALSSSAPLVYWLGCLCSLVALLVGCCWCGLEVWFYGSGCSCGFAAVFHGP